MASSAQIEANRRNSQKSTGPRTPAGKTASSQNALKSGLYSESLLIVGEESDDLDALAADYTATCNPQGPLESALVEQLVHADWLLRRIRALETQIWDNAIND